MDFLNNNGLVDGKIPPKTTCPFICDCNMKNSYCPSINNLNTDAFSCGLARAFSIDKEYK
jgi:hypothetical protein